MVKEVLMPETILTEQRRFLFGVDFSDSLKPKSEDADAWLWAGYHFADTVSDLNPCSP